MSAAEEAAPSGKLANPTWVGNPLNQDDDEDGGGGGKGAAEPAVVMAEKPREQGKKKKKEVSEWQKERTCADALFFPSLEEEQEKEWRAMKESGEASWVIHPECEFTKYWDIFSMFLIVYSCVTIPYRLGFGLKAEGSEQAFDRMVDAIFMFDCGMTFRKAIFMDSKIVVDAKTIATEYSKGWFVLDFFSSFPFDVVLGLIGGADNPDAARILKIIRIFRMIKILRMVRIKRLLKKFQDEMSIKNGVMISLKFSLVTIMASHFIACLWFSMSTSVPEYNWALSYCIWADKVNYNDGCALDVCRVKTCEIRCGFSARDSGPASLQGPFDAAETQAGEDCLDGCIDCSDMGQYTASIYYALVTMTTIGYGDILPANNDERVFCTFTMLVGASIFAYAITNMCTVVHNLNPSSVYTKGRMDELTDLCKFLKIEKNLKKKLMEFFFYKMNGSNACQYNEDEIYMDMSLTLRRQVRAYTLRKYLEAVPFLRQYTQSEEPGAQRFIGALAMKIVASPYAPGDKVCKQGADATSMFIFSKGDATVIAAEKEIATIGDCCICCASALFREGNYAYTVQMVDNGDVYELKRDDFQEVVNDYGGEHQSAAITLRKIEKRAVTAGLTITDTMDFTLDADGTPYTDPASEEEREAVRGQEIDELRQRIQYQQEYIAFLTDTLSGMSQ